MACASFALGAGSLLFCVENTVHEALRQLVVSRWEQLNRPPVGVRALEAIRTQVAKHFPDAGISPASIARILADVGAEMRHPEIIESDAAWRQKVMDDLASEFAQVQQLASEQLRDLRAAQDLIRSLETMRQKFEREQNKDGLAQLKSLGIQARQAAALIAGSADHDQLRTQSEIAEWLKVWLQTPNLFNDWLELRQRSREFRAKFPNYPA